MASLSHPVSSFSSDNGLPSNVDAERTILGAILLENQALSEAEEKLTPEDFSLDSHRRIYQRMTELGGEGRAVDLVTLANELAKYKEIESVGGVAYLASLTEGLPRRPIIEEYIRIVKDKSLLRQLMLICSAAIARAADQSETALDVLNAAESQLLVVGEKSITKGLVSLEDIVAGSFGTIDNLYSQAREVTGLATHFTEFDKMTSGLQKGELIIIAARPSMGKTAWAINIAQNAAVQGKAVVAVFSLEMSKEALLRRMLASQAWVDQRKLQTGFLGRADQDKLRAALEALVESKVFIDARQDPPAEAGQRGRSRPGGGRLFAADVRHAALAGWQTVRKPDAGSLRHLSRIEGFSQGDGCPGDRAFAAFACIGAPW
jgi:replicative DNA helicase